VLAALALFMAAGPQARSADLPSLWAARVKCVVAVEYTVETESERRSMFDYGTVVDSNGTIILPSGSVEANLPPEQLKDFKIYLPGEPRSGMGPTWARTPSRAGTSSGPRKSCARGSCP